MNKDDKCIKLQNIYLKGWNEKETNQKNLDAILQVKEQEAVISSMTSEMSESKNSIKEREKEFSSCNKGTLLKLKNVHTCILYMYFQTLRHADMPLTIEQCKKNLTSTSFLDGFLALH